MPGSRRARALGGAALALVVALALLAPARPAAQEDERPNVVVLLTDDQTVESLRAMPRVRTLIGERGTTFVRSFASFPLCCPSRATLFTGQYAHNHGVLGNRPPLGGYGRLDTGEWLPVWLRRTGYRTMHVGKFLNRYGPLSGVPPGWDEWHTSLDPSTYQFYGYTLNENGVPRTYGASGDPAEYSTDLYAARASELIAAAAERPEPFFLTVSFLAPHAGGPREPDDPLGLATPAPAQRHRDRFAAAPLPPVPSFNEQDVSDKPGFVRSRPPIGAERAAAVEENYRQRLESLLAVDEAVERILGTLRQAGEIEHTLVIFTSDNGFLHGEHRLQLGKVVAYEPSIRVPLLMRGPGVPRAERRAQLVTNADLSPTILEAAGAVPGRPQDGRSLLPLLRDRTLEWGRDLLFQGTGGFNQPGYVALRTYRYVLVRHTTGEEELYDLARDPHQLRSLHADPAHAQLKRELARRLALLRRCRGASCTRPVGARLELEGCAASVYGREVVEVRFRSRRRVRDRRPPFAAPVSGRRLRARVLTSSGGVVTRDRELPVDCR